MTPETALFLARAREDLFEARTIADVGLTRAAARSAYFALFLAAEALIFEKAGKTVKTHNGVRTEIARLVTEIKLVDRAFLTFLTQAYKYKEVADYGIGEVVEISRDEVADVIERADRWVSRIESLLHSPHEGGAPAGAER